MRGSTRYQTQVSEHDLAAVQIVRDFESADQNRRFLFGATPYAEAIADVIPVRGVIDDFTAEKERNGQRIYRSEEVPKDAIVVSTILGRPLTAARHLSDLGLTHCDFFLFSRYCSIELPPARFWTGFEGAIRENLSSIEAVRARMPELRSRQILDQIVNFRLTANLSFLEGFHDAQEEQYFESFLELSSSNETFADVGCFDGHTSAEFLKRCPAFEAIHIFEPDPNNYNLVKERFRDREGVHYHRFGLGAESKTVTFSSRGSTSAVDESGDISVEIQPLDSVPLESLTFLKMDVEGAETDVIAGASESIMRFHPRLAICAYHLPDDFWTIPELVLSIRDDYDIYLRHYTEGVVETVLFFLPKAAG